jgi:membrane-associated phospholipid phosphatase
MSAWPERWGRMRTRCGRPLLTPSSRPWAILVLASGTIVVTILAVLFAQQTRPDRLDRAVDAPFIAWFGRHEDLGQWLILPGSLAPAGVLTAAIVVTCLIGGRFNGAVLAAAAVPAADGLNDGLLKPLVHRSYLGVLTYPSGHATAVFALAATVTILLIADREGPVEGTAGALRVLIPAAAGVLAGVVAIALIGLRFHYFTDTVAGAALGTGTVCGLALVLDVPIVGRWLC